MLDFIKKDYQNNKVLFILEALATIGNIVGAVILAGFQNATPFYIMYWLWTICSMIFIYTSIKRNSTGMTLMMICYTIINLYGLYKIT
jgi:hypothetical protein